MSTAQRTGWLARSYVSRHWRGELSLPVSYFVNGFLGTIAATIAALAISSALSEGYAPWPGFVAVAATWSILLVISLWQMVGIWRSATNHPSRGGRIFWAGVAKLMVILGALQTASTFFQNGWPQVVETYNIVAGDPSVGNFSFRLMNGGTELEFSGGIPFGVTGELEKILDAAPEVHTIHLNSRGGRIGEAEKLRNLIRERDLDTYVVGECLSACTTAFLGGRNRYLHRRGRIGFHASSFPGIPDMEMQSENRRIADEAVHWGVDSSFAEKAYLSPPDEMWFPGAYELLRSNFVTSMAKGQFSISDIGPRLSRLDIISKLVEMPLYTTLSKVEPDVFQQIVDLIHAGAVSGQPEAVVFARSRNLLSDLVAKYAPTASDEALLSFGAVILEFLESIGRNDPLACYKYLFPQEGNYIDISGYITPDLQAKEFEVMEFIITTGARGDRGDHPISQELAEGIYTKVLTSIANNYDEWVIDEFILFGTDSAKVERRKVCGITYILYKEVMALPRVEAAILMRNMMSE